MKRVAFSIMYNCLHHLRHKDFARKMIENFDLWIIVEGAAGNKGSTSWCNDIHRSSGSTDGTREFILDLCKQGNDRKIITRFTGTDIWESKDEMVNEAISMIRSQGITECFLWEVDADEQWDRDQLERAETMLIHRGAKTGEFLCDYFISHDLKVRGDWGEGRALPYRRLWNWKGESFATHEPPELQGGNGKTILIGERFKHYAYVFEKDVHFKSQYYGGHENIYKPWLNLQIEAERKKLEFPLPISYLFGKNSYYSKSNSFIVQL